MEKVEAAGGARPWAVVEAEARPTRRGFCTARGGVREVVREGKTEGKYIYIRERDVREREFVRERWGERENVSEREGSSGAVGKKWVQRGGKVKQKLENVCGEGDEIVDTYKLTC